MPELPEVETVARGLAQAIEGRTIKQVQTRREDLRVPFPPGMASKLEGKRVNDCGRRAKYILIRLSGGLVFVIHLGMSGRISLIEGTLHYQPENHDHLILIFDNGMRLVFNDPRRFGMVLLVPERELDSHPAFAGLGPEPLEDDFTPAELAAALAGRKTNIKAALLDQRIVAGLGNIYISEALFHAGIDPRRAAGSLDKAEAGRLTKAIKKVLCEAIEAGGSTLKDYRRADGELGYFQHRFAVYDRAGKACPGCHCDVSRTGGILRINQGGRSTFYCPRKQK